VYIHYKQIREIWNRIQNKLGYIDRYKQTFEKLTFDDYYFLMIRKGSPGTMAEIRAKYERAKQNNFEDPPSTEIRQVEKIKSIHSYFTKYFSKPANVEAGFGRIWFASRTVSHFPAVVEYPTIEQGDLWKFLNKAYAQKKRVFEYAICWYLDPLRLSEEFHSPILKKCRDVFNEWSIKFE